MNKTLENGRTELVHDVNHRPVVVLHRGECYSPWEQESFPPSPPPRSSTRSRSAYKMVIRVFSQRSECQDGGRYWIRLPALLSGAFQVSGEDNQSSHFTLHRKARRLNFSNAHECAGIWTPAPDTIHWSGYVFVNFQEQKPHKPGLFQTTKMLLTDVTNLLT